MRKTYIHLMLRLSQKVFPFYLPTSGVLWVMTAHGARTTQPACVVGDHNYTTQFIPLDFTSDAGGSDAAVADAYRCARAPKYRTIYFHGTPNSAAKAGSFYHNTGEGGISRFHLEGGGSLVWNVGTGYFGCRGEDGKFDPEKFRENSTRPNVKVWLAGT